MRAWAALALLAAAAAVAAAHAGVPDSTRAEVDRLLSATKTEAPDMRLREVLARRHWRRARRSRRSSSSSGAGDAPLPADSNVVLSNANSINNQVVVPNCIGVGCPGTVTKLPSSSSSLGAAGGGGGGGGGSGGGKAGSIVFNGVGPNPGVQGGTTVTNAVVKRHKAPKKVARKAKKALTAALRSGKLSKAGLGHMARKALRNVVDGGRRVVGRLGSKASFAARSLVGKLQKGGATKAVKDLNKKIRKLVRKGVSPRAAVKKALKVVARKDGLRTASKHAAAAAPAAAGAASAAAPGSAVSNLLLSGPAAATRDMSWTRDQRRALKIEMKEKTAKRKAQVVKQLRKQKKEEREKARKAAAYANKLRLDTEQKLDAERKVRRRAEHKEWLVKFHVARKEAHKRLRQRMVDEVLQ